MINHIIIIFLAPKFRIAKKKKGPSKTYSSECAISLNSSKLWRLNAEREWKNWTSLFV